MEPATHDAPKASFQAAASTMKCDLIEENVTIMVHNDWSAMCCWYRQNIEKKEGVGPKPPKEIRRRMERCKGPLCELVTGYRDKLLAEERNRHSEAVSG